MLPLPSLFLAGCGPAGSETPAPVPEAPAPIPAPPRIPLVIDLHTDTLTQLDRRRLLLDAPQGLQAGSVALTAGGFNAVVYALWPGKAPQARDVTERLLGIAEKEIERLPDVELARDPTQLREIVNRGHLGIVLMLEGAHGLEPGGIEALDKLYARGVRVLAPAWSFSNRYVGSSGDQGAGFTDAGRALVAHAQSLGLVIDVSHLSAVATLEICRSSSVPLMASHSDAWALQKNARNLSDEAIRCIGEHGGVIGANLHAPFLGAPADIGRVAAHMEHTSRVAGSSAVGIGTDLDGYIRLPAGIAGAQDLPKVWDTLAAGGHSAEEIAAWKGENFFRVWEAVWAARTN